MTNNLPIFISHYRKLTERKDYLNNALKKEGFTNINWYDEIDRDHISPEDMKLYLYNSDKWNKLCAVWEGPSEPRELTLAEIANAITHIKIYTTIYTENIKIALILEDDCILTGNFGNNLNKYISQLPDNFDTCFLGDAFGWTVDNYRTGFVGKNNKNIIKPDINVYPMGCGHTSDAYIISCGGVKKILTALTKYIPFTQPIDWTLGTIIMIERINNYWGYPNLIRQGSEDMTYKSSAGREEKEKKDEKKELPKIVSQAEINLYSNITSKSYLDINKTLDYSQYNVKNILKLIDKINQGEQFILTKFGDGELINMITKNENEANCDGSNFFRKLGDELIEAYIYYIITENVYICMWKDLGGLHYDIINKINDDYKYLINFGEKFVDNDLLIHKSPFPLEKVLFFKIIKKSPRHKIYISNKDMINALCPLLNINEGISVPDKNCYLFQDEIIQNIGGKLKGNKNYILLFSCGMASKVFMFKLHQMYPQHTYIDIGSTFDGLIKKSRDFNGSQEYRNELLRNYMDDNIRWGCDKTYFNGCQYITKLIKKLITDLNVKYFIEIGSNYGNTTKFIADAFPDIKVYTVEYDNDRYNMIQDKFKSCKNIVSKRGLSVDFLNELCPNIGDGIKLYYLDAHGGNSHPLLNELKIIQKYIKGNEIIVIDDFEVPYRDNMRYDVTGDGQHYNIDWINSVLMSGIWMFFYKDKVISPMGYNQGQIVIYHKNLHNQMSKFIKLEEHENKMIPYSNITV